MRTAASIWPDGPTRGLCRLIVRKAQLGRQRRLGTPAWLDSDDRAVGLQSQQRPMRNAPANDSRKIYRRLLFLVSNPHAVRRES